MGFLKHLISICKGKQYLIAEYKERPVVYISAKDALYKMQKDYENQNLEFCIHQIKIILYYLIEHMWLKMYEIDDFSGKKFEIDSKKFWNDFKDKYLESYNFTENEKTPSFLSTVKLDWFQGIYFKETEFENVFMKYQNTENIEL